MSMWAKVKQWWVTGTDSFGASDAGTARAVACVSVVTVQPGDKILVRWLTNDVEDATREETGAFLQRVWPDNEVIGISADLTLEVWRGGCPTPRP